MSSDPILLFTDRLPCPNYSSICPLKDGRLLWVSGQCRAEPRGAMRAMHSEDGGRTWSQPSDLKHENGDPLLGVFNVSLFRMPDGNLGLIQEAVVKAHFYGDADTSICFYVSCDEGQTWSAPVQIHHDVEKPDMSYDLVKVLTNGRIVVPVYGVIGVKTPPEAKWGLQRFGENFGSEGYGLAHSYVYYSDDLGRTWRRSRNSVHVVMEGGAGGGFSFGEPEVIELKDGRLMMFGRVNLGRIFQSFSDDRGETWGAAEPADLATYAAPIRLRRIPTTGDLVVFWSQLSQWEMMSGLYRHRLSCAISKDEGQTWGHFKNLASLDDVTRIEPQPPQVNMVGPIRQPIDRVRYHRAPGPLRCNDPTCTFLNGNAIISHGYWHFGDRNVIEKTYGLKYEDVLQQHGLDPTGKGRATRVQVLPIDWFYN